MDRGDKNNQFLEFTRDAFLIQKVNKPARHRLGQNPTMDNLVLVNDDT